MEYKFDQLKELYEQKPNFFFPDITPDHKESRIYAADIIKAISEAKSKSLLLDLSEIVVSYDSSLLSVAKIKIKLIIYFKIRGEIDFLEREFRLNKTFFPEEIKHPTISERLASMLDHEMIKSINEFKKDNPDIMCLHIE